MIAKDWNKLVRSIDFQKFLALPDRVDCPGCTDAMVTWIEISNGNVTKKIEYESPSDYPEIKELQTIIQEIIQKTNPE